MSTTTSWQDTKNPEDHAFASFPSSCDVVRDAGKGCNALAGRQDLLAKSREARPLPRREREIIAVQVHRRYAIVYEVICTSESHWP